MLKFPRDCLHILSRLQVFFLCQHKVNFCLISSHSVCHLPLSSLWNHVLDTHSSFTRQNTNSILPSIFLWPTPYPLCTPSRPSNAYQHVHWCHPYTYLSNLWNAYPTHISARHNRTVFPPSSSTLWSIPTNQPQHILFKNNNSHHSITYLSDFYHLYTQLLLHHNSHTTNTISFSTPPQLMFPSFHPCHPSTLPSPSHLLRTTHINHPLSQFFTNISPHSTHIT